VRHIWRDEDEIAGTGFGYVFQVVAPNRRARACRCRSSRPPRPIRPRLDMVT
jgi:hypothetical protein